MELMSWGHYITDHFGPYRRVFLPFGGLVTSGSGPSLRVAKTSPLLLLYYVVGKKPYKNNH